MGKDILLISGLPGSGTMAPATVDTVAESVRRNRDNAGKGKDIPPGPRPEAVDI